MNRPPEWLAGLDEEDMVRQADLDQYHHRVVQLSHAQRDLLTKRIETIEVRLREIETPASQPPARPVILPPSPSSVTDEVETPAAQENSVRVPPSDVQPDMEAAVAQATSDPAPQEAPSDPFDSTARVLQLWREGRPVDEIARDLRMGRQEVQLLIEMSRHTVGASRA